MPLRVSVPFAEPGPRRRETREIGISSAIQELRARYHGDSLSGRWVGERVGCSRAHALTGPPPPDSAAPREETTVATLLRVIKRVPKRELVAMGLVLDAAIVTIGPEQQGLHDDIAKAMVPTVMSCSLTKGADAVRGRRLRVPSAPHRAVTTRPFAGRPHPGPEHPGLFHDPGERARGAFPPARSPDGPIRAERQGCGGRCVRRTRRASRRRHPTGGRCSCSAQRRGPHRGGGGAGGVGHGGRRAEQELAPRAGHD